jgi:S1-C subfamily serine protease
MLFKSHQLAIIDYPFTFVVAAFLLALFILGCSLNQFLAQNQPTTSAPTTAPTATLAPSPTVPPAPVEANANLVALIDAMGLDFAEKRVIEVYKQVSPSVVNVTTQVLRRGFFFEIIPEEGAGSGFVLDSEGHILTNYHVIRGAQSIEIIFIDGTTLPAQVVGTDPRNDIAVLKVEAAPELLVPVELGSSAQLQVGQRAIVIGNPFGQFGSSLTVGVVSALDRSLEGQDGRQITGVIQTDAAINRGNSGGPLLDSSGKVIGINTAIFSPSGTSAGIGFAVPVDTVRRILPDLLTLGRYRHPWLGIRYAYRLTPGFAEVLDLPVEKGLLLVELFPDSPLAAKDVQGAQQEVVVGNQRVFIGGDILTAVDDKEILSLEELEVLLETNYQVGDVVEVSFLRVDQEQKVQVELTEEPGR